MPEVGVTKIRIGVGLGVHTSSDPSRFAALVDGLEALGFDSLWLSERITADSPDPLTALAYAAGRTSRLKFGTSVTVLPGRNPMLLAKIMATLDQVSIGRFLPAVGLGVTSRSEQQAFGVSRDDRPAIFDEMLPLIRRFWSEDTVDHKGKFFRYDGASVRPQPAQKPLEVWLGGIASSALDRCGRLGDGWLPSFATPDDVARGRAHILQVAGRADREIDPGHFGALVPYVNGYIPDELAEMVRKRRPDVDVTDVVAKDLSSLRPLLERYIAAGASKFVVVPVVEPVNWDDHVGDIADAVHPLEN
jgi:probable F420-dependent oxidoreductase